MVHFGTEIFFFGRGEYFLKPPVDKNRRNSGLYKWMLYTINSMVMVVLEVVHIMLIAFLVSYQNLNFN